MQLDAHKSAVAKAYGLASAGYNKPALTFFSQGSKSLLDYAVFRQVKRSWMLLLEPVILRYMRVHELGRMDW